MKTLSIIIPVYDEKETLLELLALVKKADIGKVKKEIVIVDDCSKDGTREILQKLKDSTVKVMFNEKNVGKGGSIKNGLKQCTGDVIIFQDADLEYDPQDYKALLDTLEREKVDFVLGARYFPNFFSTEKQIRSHTIGNKMIAAFGNVLYGTKLTDYEPCYKLFKSEVLRSIDVKTNGFEYDIELMGKLFKHNYKYATTPISYKPRSFKEGKKINWQDGVIALWTLLRIRFSK